MLLSCNGAGTCLSLCTELLKGMLVAISFSPRCLQLLTKLSQLITAACFAGHCTLLSIAWMLSYGEDKMLPTACKDLST